MTQTACPSCGDPIALRQLVCLKCGARLALQPTPWARQPVTVFATVLIALIVIGAGLFGFAISELTSDDGDGGFGSTQAVEKTTPSQTARDAPAVVSGGEQAARTAEEPQPSRGSDPLEGSAGADRVPAWPDGLSAHTVVLVTSGDRASALNAAKEARASGLEAGLLRSDPYDLGTGLWIVFSGQFTTPEGAERQATQLGDRYPGAYPQLVQRVQ